MRSLSFGVIVPYSAGGAVEGGELMDGYGEVSHSLLKTLKSKS
jgi:hypothetical protein